MKKLCILWALLGCGVAYDAACAQGVSSVWYDQDTLLERDFTQRIRAVSNNKVFSAFSVPMADDVRKCMMFLYAYMPLPDLTDYSGVYYRENVTYSLKARREMPWGKSVPDREFMHFVLPVRVNNENLDESRRIFYNELKNRVQHLSMYDAVLEVNHWCHEKVTYQPSDARTSSPLASVKTAYGRCGEESTLLVAALRAVGIPARQVYTPRWAHTDDNHAWVEAWVDGKWYFLGACEPEPVLNKAWFNSSASRGMMMHTKVFGRYDGPEQVLGRTPCYTEINVTSHYAPVSDVQVKVVNKRGAPVPGARVQFKVYNYAEFYTLASLQADSTGQVRLSLGRGDIMVWADHQGTFGFSKVSVGKDSDVRVVLDKTSDWSGGLDIDIVPPRQSGNLPKVSEEQEDANKKRLAYEDSVRNAYVATFPDHESQRQFALHLQQDTALVCRLLTASRGNYATLQRFMSENIGTASASRWILPLLGVLTDKDLRDVSSDVLQDHLLHTPSCPKDMPDDIYARYVLNPRVDNEMLTPYKAFFVQVLSKEKTAYYQSHPDEWAMWCRKNVAIDSVWNPQALCMHPESVWELRKTDEHSRKIFFVSVARSLGIAARIDPVTGEAQYWKQGVWYGAGLEHVNASSSSEGATLVKAGYKSVKYLEDPKYYTHFTLSKIVNGVPVLLNYPENATWSSLLKDGVSLSSGQYLLVTGVRLADGGVLSRMQIFKVPEKKQKMRISLKMREAQGKVEVIGNLNAESLYGDLSSRSSKSILSTAGRGYYVLGIVAPNTEPTNHAIRDLKACRRDLEKWGRKILLLFPSEQAYEQNIRKEEFSHLPSTVVCGVELNHEIRESLAKDLHLNSELQLPVFVIADSFNRVVYFSQGYTIGLGEQLLKVIGQLE